MPTTLPDYTTLVSPFRARSGTHDTLPDTLRIPFTGIPVVINLKAVYDTAKGTARISWHPVDYPFLSEYAVFRDPVGALEVSSTPVSMPEDTLFIDSLFTLHVDQANAAKDTGTLRFEYRV